MRVLASLHEVKITSLRLAILTLRYGDVPPAARMTSPANVHNVCIT